jgi:RNA polymerase sigma-70 factor (ECF subfamily)
VTERMRRKAFATTRWTLVNAALRENRAGADAALEELCEIYWPPLYGYLRGRGYPAEQAQDLTQGFFTRLLETDAINLADPSRGRFRAFLLTALKRYVIGEYERGAAARRGGRHAHFSLDFTDAERLYSSERRNDDTPERIFHRNWATITLERALQRLRTEYAQSEKDQLAAALFPYLSESSGLPPYRAIATQLGLTEGAVRVAVHRLRQRYGAILRAEIAETVIGEHEIDAELRDLLRAVST